MKESICTQHTDFYKKISDFSLTLIKLVGFLGFTGYPGFPGSVGTLCRKIPENSNFLLENKKKKGQTVKNRKKTPQENRKIFEKQEKTGKQAL